MTRQDALVIDLDRCIGCRGGCQVACKNEHGIALGDARSHLYQMGPTGTYPDLEMYFLPVMCQQCADAPCAAVCPTGACYKSERDGVVYIDKDICVGCESCVRACPYGAVYVSREMRVADKCDLCAERREAGEAPACVRNCSGQAIRCGDVHDPDSEVSRLLLEAGAAHVHALKDSGNGPCGRFILRRGSWTEELPGKEGSR